MSEEKEINNTDPEEKKPEKQPVKKRKNKNKKHKGAFIVGIIVIIFAVVGVVFTANFGIKQIYKLTSNDKEKAEYEDYLYPVVTLDTGTFDDVTGADMDDLICSAILSLLTDGDSNPYDFEFVEGEVSGMGIPQETVEEAFTALFGSDVKPVHRSVECSTCVFTYQSTAKRYVIPITSYDPAYAPDVIEINKTEESVELLVGYVAYGDWETNDSNEYTQPEPAKYRRITLRQQDGGYYISAIQNADAPDK